MFDLRGKYKWDGLCAFLVVELRKGVVYFKMWFSLVSFSNVNNFRIYLIFVIMIYSVVGVGGCENGSYGFGF